MRYLPAIIILGYVLPSVAGILFLGGGLMGWLSFSNEWKVRVERLALHHQHLQSIQELGVHSEKEAQRLEFIRLIMSGDQYTDIGEKMRILERELGGGVRRTSYRREGGGRTALDPVITQPREILELGFRGRYLPMQTTFFQLEQDRPNLILDRLKVDMASEGDATAELRFDARYLALVEGAQK